MGGGGNAPLWLRNLRARLMFKLKYGALQRYNLEPKNPPLNRRIVVSDEFYPLVSHGAIEVARGGVASVDGDVVTFADGSSGAFDAARFTCDRTGVDDELTTASSSDAASRRTRAVAVAAAASAAMVVATAGPRGA